MGLDSQDPQGDIAWEESAVPKLFSGASTIFEGKFVPFYTVDSANGSKPAVPSVPTANFHGSTQFLTLHL